MHHSTTCPRGVWFATFTEESGHRWVFSVDSRGVRVNLRVIAPDQDPVAILDALWAELDRADPMPSSLSSDPSCSALRLMA